MKILIDCADSKFLCKINYVSIYFSLVLHKYELFAKIKDAYWQKLAEANIEEELKIWWDMQNSSAPLV